MKKILIIIFIFCAIAWAFNSASAQTFETESVIFDPVNGGFNVSVGSPYYQDSLFVYDFYDVSGVGSVVLISTTTSYTILSITEAYISEAPQCPLACGSTVIYNPIPAIGSGSFTSNIPIHCTGNLTSCSTDNGSIYFYVQYVPYDTRINNNTMDQHSSIDTIITPSGNYYVPFLNYLLVLSVLSFTILILFFVLSILRKRKK